MLICLIEFDAVAALAKLANLADEELDIRARFAGWGWPHGVAQQPAQFLVSQIRDNQSAACRPIHRDARTDATDDANGVTPFLLHEDEQHIGFEDRQLDGLTSRIPQLLYDRST